MSSSYSANIVIYKNTLNYEIISKNELLLRFDVIQESLGLLKVRLLLPVLLTRLIQVMIVGCIVLDLNVWLERLSTRRFVLEGIGITDMRNLLTINKVLKIHIIVRLHKITLRNRH